MSKTRQKARRLAAQALYTWQMSGEDISDIEGRYSLDHDMAKVDTEYFNELLHKVPAHLIELDEHLEPLLDRPINEVDPVERAILRMGSYELAFRLDVPYRVAINEAVNLTKTFGADQSHKYVNGVLDALAKKLRAAEIKAKTKAPARKKTSGK